MNLNKTNPDLKESLLTDAGKQRADNRNLIKLQAFIRECPVTIRYGCHTIRLAEDDSKPGGFTFNPDNKKENPGLSIRIN